MRRLIKVLLGLLVLSSCNNSKKDETPTINNEQTEKLPEMIIDRSSDGWGGDVSLYIKSTEKISSEVTLFKIVSDYNGNPVGFSLLLKRPKEKNMFVSKGLTFISLKDTSTNFLKALANIYRVERNDLVFGDSITITYADLAANVDLNKPGNWIAAQMKLFFETDDDNPELFLNIDEKARIISLPEKDSTYREGIIKALSKKN